MTSVKLIKFFFMETSQSCPATLTYYSTEPLTTGSKSDPLFLLISLAGDVHTNPGPPRYPCSVCFKNVTSQCTSYLCTRCSQWVHSRCSGLRNVTDYRRANGWICTIFHTSTMSDNVFNILKWNANGIGNKQTELSIFLEAHNVKGHSGVQVHGTIEKSQHQELHPSTTGSTKPME